MSMSPAPRGPPRPGRRAAARARAITPRIYIQVPVLQLTQDSGDQAVTGYKTRQSTAYGVPSYRTDCTTSRPLVTVFTARTYTALRAFSCSMYARPGAQHARTAGQTRITPRSRRDRHAALAVQDISHELTPAGAGAHICRSWRSPVRAMALAGVSSRRRRSRSRRRRGAGEERGASSGLVRCGMPPAARRPRPVWHATRRPPPARAHQPRRPMRRRGPQWRRMVRWPRTAGWPKSMCHP